MVAKRSPGSFCSLVVSNIAGTTDSITSINTTNVGNGAEAYCAANLASYRYSASLTQATLADVFVQPGSGVGCWIKQSANADFASNFQLTTSAAGSSVAPTQGVWAIMPAALAAYQQPNFSALWSLSIVSGVMTYLGPLTKSFLILMTAAVTTDAGAIKNMQMDVSFNGSLISTSNELPTSCQGTLLAGTTNAAEFSHQIILPFSNNSFFRYGIRVTSASPGDIAFQKYQVQMIAL